MACILTLSATDVALAAALRNGTLRRVERQGRFGAYVSLEDAHGVIEVHTSSVEADARLDAIRGRS